MPSPEVEPWRGRTRERPSFPFPLPDEPMALVRGGRPLKRWRWVGCFGPDVMLCAAQAKVGPGRLSWWAIWDGRYGELVEGVSRLRRPVRLEEGSARVGDGRVRVDLRFQEDEVEEVETVSPHGAQYAWTRKRAGVPVRGTVQIGTRRLDVDGRGVIDDSAGYHARTTAWRWCAGVGRLDSGASVGWNLVNGLHDDPSRSERSVWVDGVAHQVAPVEIATDLTRVVFATGVEVLDFSAVATRSHREHLGLVSSSYEQPFGTFSGTLPGAGHLREGWGVMERHEARW